MIRPQGGLTSGDIVYVVSFLPSDTTSLYVLTTGVNNVVTLSQAYTTTGSVTTTSPPLQFTLSSLAGSVVLKNGSNYLSYGITGNPTMLTLGAQKPLYFDQSSTEPFPDPPNILLSGIQYTLFGITSTTTLNSQLSVTYGDVTTQVIPAVVMVVKTSYYTGCTSTSEGSMVTSLASILQLLYCSYNSTAGICSGVTNAGAWTNLDLCIVGNTFSYCSPGTRCTGNCLSACESDTQICQFQGNQTYACVNRPTTTVGTTPNPPTSPIAPTGIGIGGIIVIIVVILIIIALLAYFFYGGEGRRVSTYEHEDHVDTYVGAGGMIY